MPTSAAVRIPGVLLSTLDFRYPVKHFEIDKLRHKRRRGQMQFLPFCAGAEGRDKVTLYLPLVQVSCGDSAAAGVMPSPCVVMNVRVSAASGILVPRAKRHKGSSVDSLAAEKTGPLLIFRFGLLRSAPVAPPTFNG